MVSQQQQNKGMADALLPVAPVIAFGTGAFFYRDAFMNYLYRARFVEFGTWAPTPAGYGLMFLLACGVVGLIAGVIVLAIIIRQEIIGWSTMRPFSHHLPQGVIVLGLCGVCGLVWCCAGSTGRFAEAILVTGVSMALAGTVGWLVDKPLARERFRAEITRQVWPLLGEQHRHWRIVKTRAWQDGVPTRVSARVGVSFKPVPGTYNAINRVLKDLGIPSFSWDYDRKNNRITGHDPHQASRHSGQGRVPSQEKGGFLGKDDQHRDVRVPARRASLVIGPPGSGKTQGVIMPSVLAAPAACVSTSVKTEVMAATAGLRSQRGRIWVVDPTCVNPDQPGLVRWSPLLEVNGWDSALEMAARLTSSAKNRSGGENMDHFISRAETWLSCILFAAWLNGRDFSVFSKCVNNPLGTLTKLEKWLEADHPTATRLEKTFAQESFNMICSTPDKERGSIASALTNLLKIYTIITVMEQSRRADFDVDAFVRSHDTLYISVPVEKQQIYAPFIGALLESIRFAQYRKHNQAVLAGAPTGAPVTFVLDEAANTAAMPIPKIMSEAGGQGLHLVVALQSMTQASDQWGETGRGMLSLATDLFVLSGIRDHDTLQILSAIAGQYQRRSLQTGTSGFAAGGVSGHNGGAGFGGVGASLSSSFSTMQDNDLNMGDISDLPTGKGLYFRNQDWEMLTLDPFWTWGDTGCEEFMAVYSG